MGRLRQGVSAQGLDVGEAAGLDRLLRGPVGRGGMGEGVAEDHAVHGGGDGQAEEALDGGSDVDQLGRIVGGAMPDTR